MQIIMNKCDNDTLLAEGKDFTCKSDEEIASFFQTYLVQFPFTINRLNLDNFTNPYEQVMVDEYFY